MVSKYLESYAGLIDDYMVKNGDDDYSKRLASDFHNMSRILLLLGSDRSMMLKLVILLLDKVRILSELDCDNFSFTWTEADLSDLTDYRSVHFEPHPESGSNVLTLVDRPNREHDGNIQQT
jgi:hypothetical protein